MAKFVVFPPLTSAIARFGKTLISRFQHWSAETGIAGEQLSIQAGRISVIYPVGVMATSGLAVAYEDQWQNGVFMVRNSWHSGVWKKLGMLCWQ